MLCRARLDYRSLIVTEDNSKDLKVAVGVERSLQGSQGLDIKEFHASQ